MDYEGFFRKRLGALHAEGRYRVFADLERRCGRFPRAYDHRIGVEVAVWCSNDHLGMGQLRSQRSDVHLSAELKLSQLASRLPSLREAETPPATKRNSG
jgi:7-keto-8-aminopelargonate synthetase-like enzyme